MGVVGGMGMGGGSVLIPFLTIILGVSQTVSQGYNLLAFVPMAIVAIAFHIKNKLFVFKTDVVWFVVSGLVSSIGSAFLAQFVPPFVLSKIFGIFLLVLSLREFYLYLQSLSNKK